MPIVKVGASRGEEFNFSYETYGRGQEKLILIMGFLTPGSKWKRQLEFLEQFYDEIEVCIFDNRGVGSTGTPKSSFTTKEMARDVVELMDHLQWDQAHVLGVSMGGMISIELAHYAPKRIKSLILAVTHAGSMAPAKGMAHITRTLFERSVTKRAEILLEILYSATYLAQPHLTQTDKTNKQVLIEDYIESQKTDPQPTLPAVAGHIRAVMTHRVSEKRLNEIKESKIPILIMTGTKDDLVKSSNSYHLSKVLEPVDFIVYENSGHCINIENYDDFNNAIISHFRKYYSTSLPSTATTTTNSQSVDSDETSITINTASENITINPETEA
ncbi:hypothetical protein CYY_003290 [Polysphondylium violaceum]|uniref:AB hydrolase-1 domain-containing protein n=1 Tax=Polysphondylium violaceum TaxID=133409 RepID=A0A8J4PX89_9MYCE|nr:hypothetical protein CYY_003290 [Polysphondylium violaceum]